MRKVQYLCGFAGCHNDAIGAMNGAIGAMNGAIGAMNGAIGATNGADRCHEWRKQVVKYHPNRCHEWRG